MRKSRWLVVLFFAALLAGGLTFAQRRYRGDRAGVPDWEPDKEFSKDVFTFVRIEYSGHYGGGRYGRGGGRGARESGLRASLCRERSSTLECHVNGRARPGHCRLSRRMPARPMPAARTLLQDLPSGLAEPDPGSSANISICSGWLASTMGPLRQPSQPRYCCYCYPH